MHEICESHSERSYFHRTIARTPWAVLIAIAVALLVPPAVLEAHHTGTVVTLLLWLWWIGFAMTAKRCINQFWSDVNKEAKEKRREPVETDVNRVILEAFTKWDKAANTHRDNLDNLATAAAILSPAAVLALSLQIIWLKDQPSGIVAIAAEIAVLVSAMATIYHERFPFNKIPKKIIPSYVHEHWIPSRLTAELLRRELFLVLARIGPYQRCTSVEDVKATTVRRCSAVDRDTKDPLPLPKLVELVQMQDGGLYWRDILEDLLLPPSEKDYAPQQRDLPRPPSLRQYLDERLVAQEAYYFIPRGARHGMLDHGFESTARLALGVALILAILHIKIIIHHALWPDPVIDVNFQHFLEISALVMPAIGAGCITLRAFFENHRLSRSYIDQARQLDNLYTLFADLETQWQGDPESPDAPGALMLTHRFQRLVLRTETLLTAELRRWWLIVEPEQPTGG